MTTIRKSKAPPANPPAKDLSKLDRLIALLKAPDGATMAEMIAVTDWQAHSVRGALAGQLRKKGHAAQSQVIDGVRRWKIGEAAEAAK